MNKLTYSLSETDKRQISAVSNATQTLEIKFEKLKAAVSSELSTPEFPFPTCEKWLHQTSLNFPCNGGDPNPAAYAQIWSLSEGITALPETLKDPRLPALSVWKMQQGDAACRNPAQMTKYGWGTLLKFRIQNALQDPKLPIGSRCYFFSGMNAKDVLMLERLLVALGSSPEDNCIAQASILYPMGGSGHSPEGWQSDPVCDCAMLQTNHQTDPRPGSVLTNACGPLQGVRMLQGARTFMEQMLKCSTAGEGHFYYYNAGTDSGLPDHLFASGNEVEISLLLLFAKPSSTSSCDVLTPYMNVMVSADIVNPEETTVYAKCETVQVNYRFTPNDSLYRVAKFFYMNPTHLGEAIADEPLTDGVTLSVPLGLYEVRPTAPSGTLNDIASFFGKTADEIVKANPDISDWSVPLPLRTIVNLPPGYIPSARGKPWGETLRNVANCFHVGIDALVLSNELTEGLIRPGVVASFQAGPTIRRNASHPGIVSMEASRTVEELAEQPDPGDMNYGELYLKQMFHMLRGRIAENVHFRQSPFTLPLSPTDRASDKKCDSSFKRRFAAVKVENDDWNYSPTIPYAPFCLPFSAPSIVLPRLNPNLGVGQVVQTDFEWLDVFGNKLAAPGGTREFLGPSVRLGYTDDLIGLDQWPSVTSHYDIIGAGGVRQLVTVMSFNPKRYDDDSTSSRNSFVICGENWPAWKLRALTDLRLYDKLLAQFRDPITPDDNGKDHVSVNVHCSLFGFSFPIKKNEKKNLINWILSVREFLEKKIAGQNSPPPPPLQLKFALQMKDIRKEAFFPLTVEFRMERDCSKVIAGRFDSVSVYETVAEIPPHRRTSLATTLRSDDSSDLHTFAAKLEEALQGFETFRIKLGTGLNRNVDGLAKNRETLWAIRIDSTMREGIGFHSNGEYPLLYAPRPLVTAPVTIESKTYFFNDQSGNDSDGKLAKRDIRIDEELRTVLEAIDHVFLPSMMAPAMIVDLEFYEAMVKCKKNLACSLKLFLIPSIEGQPEPEAGIRSARDAFEQQLLGKLSRFYTIDAALQLPMQVGNASDSKTRLYGSFHSVGNSSVPLSLTNAKLPIEKTTETNPAYLTGFVSTNPMFNEKLALPSSELGFNYSVTHIEHERRKVDEIADYETAAWIQFLLPELSYDFKSEIPFILRAYPSLPILNHAAYPAEKPSDPNEWQQAFIWEYVVSWERDFHFPQDETEMTIHFNIKETSSLLSKRSANLAHSLIKFIDVYKGLKTAWLEKLSAWTEKDLQNDENRTAAKLILNTFLSNAQDVQEEVSAAINKSMKTEVDDDCIHMIIKEVPAPSPDDTEYRLKLRSIGNSLPNGIKLDLHDGGNLLPGEEHPLESTQDEKVYTFKNPDGTKVNLENGRKITKRIVSLTNLPLSKYQNACATASVTRNNLELASGRSVRSEFIYRTPPVSTDKPAAVTIEYAEEINMDSWIDERNQQPIDAYLNELFSRLYADYHHPKAEIIVEQTYSFDLSNDIQPIRLPISHANRYNLVTPPGPPRYKPLTENFRDATTNWLQSEIRSVRNGKVWFDVTLQSAVSYKPRDLLRLSKLYIPLDRLLLNRNEND